MEMDVLMEVGLNYQVGMTMEPGPDSPGRIPIEHAVSELARHPAEIGTVDQWARHMGYSRSYFSTRFREVFGRGALDVFSEVKYKLIISFLIKRPQLNSSEIAVQAGFWNDRALRRFLRNGYRINISQLRQLCSEERLFGDGRLKTDLILPGRAKPNQ